MAVGEGGGNAAVAEAECDDDDTQTGGVGREMMDMMTPTTNPTRAKRHAYRRASIHTLRRERWWAGVSLALSVCLAIATGYVWVPALCLAAFAVLEVQARRDVRAIEETEE